MEHLNVVNLFQAGIITSGVLGALLFWFGKPAEYQGIALFLALTVLASVINILEESGLTRDIYLISPVFIMLFGPATYLAVKLLIDKALPKQIGLHFLPVIPLLFLTQQVHLVIALGTVWRIVYSVFTAMLLLKYKHALEQQRSDSTEHSMNWLVWLIIIVAGFNVVDLIRLNSQTFIGYELNVWGQGLNTLVWLVASIILIVKLQLQTQPPAVVPDKSSSKEDNKQDYQTLFDIVNDLVTSKQLYLTPRLTLQDLSEATGINTREISRAINLVADKSFNEYINQFRVDHVCRLLKQETTSSLTLMAEQAGFSSKASFNSVFKQLVGLTPSQYRAKH